MDNFKHISEKLNTTVLDISASYCGNGKKVCIHQHLMDECLRSTRDSVTFHGIPTGQLDHYKYAGHISFWFARLQPLYFTFEAPYKRKTEKHSSHPGVETKVLMNADTGEVVQEEMYLLNELAAVEIAYIFITGSQQELAESVSGKVIPQELVDFENHLNLNEQKFTSSIKDLSWSLRKHNHTCRTWTTLLESMFRTPLERKFMNGSAH